MILADMLPELQIEYENMNAYNMIKHLKKLFDTKGYETFKKLFSNLIIELS